MKYFFTSLAFATAFLFISCSTYSQTEFWGMSREGGTFGFGSIFKTDNQGENPFLIYSFTDTLNGIHPEGSLIQAENRKLYGMTKFGGIFNMGTIFEFDVFTNTFLKLQDFDSISNGCYPSGSLTLAYNNTLFGKNGFGGQNNLGIMFKFDINTNTLTKILDFDITTTGGNSENGSLTISNNINSIYSSGLCLIGSNPVGGSTYQGVITVYEVFHDTITQRIEFPTMPGLSSIRGDLIEISPGKFLGMNATGGNILGGYIYEYNWNTNTFLIKLSFDSLSGYAPLGKMTKGLNGKYYGLTSAGGSNGTGTLFEYDLNANSFTHIIDFGSLFGNISNPRGSLMLGTNGKLYGMGTYGAGCGGVIFEYDYNIDQLLEKTDLCSTIGSELPYYTSLIEINRDTILKIWPGDCSLNRTVNNADFLYIGVAYGETGPARTSSTTNFVGQFCTPWTLNYIGESLNGLVNGNHADCNGDGFIDTLDILPIYNNYERVRPLRLSSTKNKTYSHDYLCPVADRNSVAPGDPVNFGIYMASNTVPMDYAYGIAFTIQFDPSLVDTNRISLDFSNSVLGNRGVDMITFEKNFYSSGMIHVALVRTDHTDLVNVGGLVATLNLYASTAVTSLSSLKINTWNITAIRSSGGQFELHDCLGSVAVDPNMVNIEPVSFNKTFFVFPNPAREQLIVKVNDQVIQVIELYNGNGKKVLSMTPNKNEININTSEFPAGIYFVRFITGENVFTSPVHINH